MLSLTIRFGIICKCSLQKKNLYIDTSNLRCICLEGLNIQAQAACELAVFCLFMWVLLQALIPARQCEQLTDVGCYGESAEKPVEDAYLDRS